MAKDNKETAVAVTEGYMSDVRKSTKASLDLQPKFKVRLPVARKGDLNYEIVGVNGFNYQIKKGVEVEVPETVFNILKDADLV